MSFRLKIDGKSRKSARFISQLQKAIQSAFISSGMTQQEVATALEVDRSVVNRRLKSNANLTARSIAEFAYALEKDIEFKLVDRNVVVQANSTTSPGDGDVIDLSEVKKTPTTTGPLLTEAPVLESAAL